MDAGANRGEFSKRFAKIFPVSTIAIEANPDLVKTLRASNVSVLECALGSSNGTRVFYIGVNDEASSVRKPTIPGAHLQIKRDVIVQVKSIGAIIEENNLTGIVCVKLDIEGSEVEVLAAVAPLAKTISPQWTVEFHDEAQFGLCSKAEVDEVLRLMRECGFSILSRNWPARTNVLFLDRGHLKIGPMAWFWLKLRYEWFAYLWRKVIGIG